ncbi:PAS domain S-box protein [Sorangium sp. So ce1389]|uniref:PAS domain S-box protein n=1 Tax=Sorangium sp. So ce1389 TaxID=3133336 RepID=UPI003F5DB395
MSQRDLYRAAFEAAEDALLLLEGGRVIEANPSATRLFSGNAEGLLGRALADLSPLLQPDGQDSAGGLKQRIDAASRGEPQRFRWLYRRPGGGLIVADTQLARLALPDGAAPILRAVVHEEDKEQRRLYALAVDMLGIATLDGRFKELSPSWERTLGFSRQELMARPYLDFIHPEDKARTLSETDTFSTGAQTLTYENRFLCKDGSYRWLEWNAMLALDEGRVYFVARDVTRRKSAELALRESEEKLRALYEGIPHYLTVVDKDARIVSANRSHPGVSTESLVGRSLYDFSAPEYHDTVRQALETVLTTGGRAHYEVVGLGANGGRAWYANHVSAIPGAGEITNALIVSENITDRRQAEEQRRHSEARFHAAVEASMDAFLTMTSRHDESEEIADLVITGLNARAAAMLSMPREELLGKRLSELEHSVEADVLLDKCLRVVRKGTPLEEEILLPAPPGQASRPGTWVHHQIVPIQGGVAVTMRDTTDRKRLEDQLRQSIDRLEAYAEELEGKNRMLADENAERERTASVLRQQQEAIRALSTPIIQAWEGVLVLPIIGALDSGRATQIMEKLLGEVVRTQAHFAVLDLTGVEDVDAPTVDHLLQVARAASLLGSRCLISGISPGVAQAIVELGNDARTFETFGELEDALRHALRVSGARLPRLRRGQR